ncbi:PAS domain-containing sensor histidine kinase [Geobacter sp. FeAm09]|uniref:ATP-binding protein n=1 Tax=Geobacter sp. FeAm09 TaxID=2597769 RepID=UPI00143D5043|nr:PAS domain-containing sensor histidine kinase [Geobacter sp. FeAm09]
MNRGDLDIRRVTTLFAGIVAVAIALLIPAGYFVASSGYLHGGMETQAALLGRASSEAVAAQFENSRRLLVETAWVAVGSALFGVLVFLAFRIFPYRALSRAQSRLDVREQQLAEANEQLRRELDERLRAEKLLFKMSAAIRQCPVSVIIMDMDGVIEFANPKFIEMMKASEDEVIGRKLFELKASADPGSNFRDVWQTVVSGTAWHGEWCSRGRDGGGFWEYVTIFPVSVQDAGATNCIAIMEDINGRKSLEEQLRHSQKMDAMGQIAGGVAHDFSNLLTVIIGYATMLKNNPRDPDTALDRLDSILSAANRGVQLTGSLLAFSRKQILNPRLVDLVGIVRNMEDFLRQIIGEDIVLETEYDVGKCYILADSSNIEQVIMNLAANARDVMPNGGRISVKVAKTELDNDFVAAHGYGPAGQHALLSVTDTGSGIGRHTLTRIFEPFFTTKEVGRGTGLGLSIVHGIVKQHNGYLTVSSREGVGTSFFVFLPLARDSFLSGDDDHGADAASDDRPAGSGGVLVAEDDALVRALVSSILAQHGYAVISAEDGEDAVAKFHMHAGKVDLLLMDVVMPKMGGWHAYQKIRESRADIKAIFISGYASDDLLRNGLPAAGVNVLQKPLKQQELLTRVREILDI